MDEGRPVAGARRRSDCGSRGIRRTAGAARYSQGVSFTLEPGEFLGVIGPSGSGKSTLARLLTGVWSPQAGAVRLDGAEITNGIRRSWGVKSATRPRTSNSFPEPSLKILPAWKWTTPRAVIEAGRAAGVHALVLGLPDGYGTEIGINGENLSGGQRQRIALARASTTIPVW